MLSYLVPGFLFHLEFIPVYGMKVESIFIFFQIHSQYIQYHLLKDPSLPPATYLYYFKILVISKMLRKKTKTITEKNISPPRENHKLHFDDCTSLPVPMHTHTHTYTHTHFYFLFFLHQGNSLYIYLFY